MISSWKTKVRKAIECLCRKKNLWFGKRGNPFFSWFFFLYWPGRYTPPLRETRNTNLTKKVEYTTVYEAPAATLDSEHTIVVGFKVCMTADPQHIKRPRSNIWNECSKVKLDTWQKHNYHPSLIKTANLNLAFNYCFTVVVSVKNNPIKGSALEYLFSRKTFNC